MQLNKHGSFYIRSGWPTKIMDAIAKDRYVFSAKNELNAVDSIGVGRVMVKSMRYWANVMGIASEAKDQTGVYFEFTPMGNILRNHDLYCQSMNTLWLLHRNVALASEEATAWHWLFNQYRTTSFTKESFSAALYAYLQNNGSDYAQRAVEKEFDCVKNTYIRDEAFSIAQVIEENTVPFFAPLHLLEREGTSYTKRKVKSDELQLELAMYCILADNFDTLRTSRQISIEQLFESECQICRYINLSYASLVELLQRLDAARLIALHNNFGNRYVDVLATDMDDLLERIYHINMG